MTFELNDRGVFETREACREAAFDALQRLKIAFGGEWGAELDGLDSYGYEFQINCLCDTGIGLTVLFKGGGYVACVQEDAHLADEDFACDTPEQAVREYAKYRIEKATRQFGHFAGLVTNQNQDD